MEGTAQVDRAHLGYLDGVIRPYAWGSHTAIADLQGRPAPTARPEAELWFGAHPSDPSRLLGAGTTPDDGSPLDTVITSDPVGCLGERVIARFGPRLPFLVKILAIDQPLSLQVHPSAEQAVVGFHAEEAGGVPLDAPERTYRDPWPKPELLCALTRVDALCGFREVPVTLDLLERLAIPTLASVTRRLATDGAAALREVVRQLLSWPAEERAPLVTAVTDAARTVAAEAGGHAPTADWLVRLGTRYPNDPGVVVACLMHLVRLEPGEALVLPAGNLHAYLQGTAIEVMATSDNVLRGGLTKKHVDVEGLLQVLDPTPRDLPRVTPVTIPGGHAYPGGVSHFALERLNPGGHPVTTERRGPEIWLAVGGDAEVVADRRSLSLRSGQAVFVPASVRHVTVGGEGPVFRATVGEPD